MSNFINHSVQFCKRHGSTILTTVGGVGVIATSVMAVKATPKAMERIEEAKKEKGEELTKTEVVLAAGPAYIPAVLIGAGTLACIFGANILSKRQQAELISAYVLLDKSYKEYRNKVEELYGKTGVERIEDEIAKDHYEPVNVADDKQLFYDVFSKRYFESTLIKLAQAEYDINRDIHMQGWAELNDFYEHLDLDNIPGGDCLGWSEGGNLARYWQGWIDFGHRKMVMDDGTECIAITMFMEPYPNYEDEYCGDGY